jgi:hypothetical protein
MNKVKIMKINKNKRISIYLKILRFLKFQKKMAINHSYSEKKKMFLIWEEQIKVWEKLRNLKFLRFPI